uniref:F-box domain-containing protein n=1 Tax=Moniliophthora roreri TaxID=221103 RepID=A0A0W0FK92_MONRR
MGSTAPLPSELLAEIFKINRELDAQDKNILPETLITASAVCRFWREIILNTPALWSDIWVPFRLLKRLTSALEWINLWLKHSGSDSCSLRVSIEFNDSFSVFPVLDCIIPYAKRLRSFRFLAIGDTSLSPDALSAHLRNVNAPCLEELDVHFVGRAQSSNWKHLLIEHPDPTITRGIFSFFASSPKVHTLTLRGVMVPFPLEQLTSLDLQNITVVDDRVIRDMAARCPALNRLALLLVTFTIMSQANVTSGNTEPIYMPSLRTLIIGFDNPIVHSLMDAEKHVLSFFLAPNLEYMEISGKGNGYGLNLDLHNVLPDPSTLTSLHSLKLQNVSTFYMSLSGATRPNAHYFMSLPCIRHVHLVHTPGEVLGVDLPGAETGVRRSRSGELEQPATSQRPLARDVMMGTPRDYAPVILATSHTEQAPESWQHLRSIALETIRAQDMMWLCQILAVRPQIQVVSLSRSARRHLSLSLMMHVSVADGKLRLRMKKPGYTVFLLDSQVEGDHGSEISVEEWIKERVELRRL